MSYSLRLQALHDNAASVEHDAPVDAHPTVAALVTARLRQATQLIVDALTMQREHESQPAKPTAGEPDRRQLSFDWSA